MNNNFLIFFFFIFFTNYSELLAEFSLQPEITSLYFEEDIDQESRNIIEDSLLSFFRQVCDSGFNCQGELELGFRVTRSGFFDTMYVVSSKLVDNTFVNNFNKIQFTTSTSFHDPLYKGYASVILTIIHYQPISGSRARKNKKILLLGLLGIAFFAVSLSLILLLD